MKKLTALAAIACSLVITACNADTKAAKPVEPATEDQKAVYSIGLLISKQLKGFELTPEELALVQKGLADGIGSTPPTIKAEDYLPKIQQLQLTRMSAAGTAYLEKAAKESGATKTASGIVIKHTVVGTGVQPKATDSVKVHYEGKLIDGSVFDSSIQRGQPIDFGLDGVIPCWTEGVQTMKVGGKAKLVCPANLAYGEQGRPGIPPNAVLTFDVELIDINKPQEPPKASPPAK